MSQKLKILARAIFFSLYFLLFLLSYKFPAILCILLPIFLYPQIFCKFDLIYEKTHMNNKILEKCPILKS